MHPSCRQLMSRAVLGLLLLPLVGCAVAHQWFYGDGPTVPAAYSGLEGKKVAVVCTMNSSTYGAEDTANLLAESVGKILQRNVKDIQIVRQEDVADWIDTNTWDELDYVEIGKGVKADLVVAIDLNGFSLHEGKTLYKGRADVTTSVYDVVTGIDMWSASDPEVTFPQNHSVPATSKSETSFKRLFLQVLAQDIARSFYEYKMQEDFAVDAAAYAH